MSDGANSTNAPDHGEADRRKDRFLSVLVHELRNPLAPIQNAVEVLKLSRPVSERVDRCSDLIDRQVSRMAQLLDDLVDVHRIERGTFEIRKGWADLRSVLEQAIARAQPAISDRGHTLEVELPPSGCEIEGDAPRLTQLFALLLDNAAKFTDRGGTIVVNHGLGPGQALVTVTDNGMGLDPAIASLAFEPFALAGTSMSGTGNSLGLGLPLAKGIVERHGGTISIAGAGPGKGTQVKVELPMALRASEPLREEASASPLERWRMVLADDRQLNADALSELIRLQGHDVVTVYDGDAAVAAAEQMRPNAVILDIGMPGVDGYEACRRIRAESWGRDIVIIALTGWGQTEVGPRTREAGFTTHLLKPVDHLTLLGNLAQLRKQGAPPVA